MLSRGIYLAPSAFESLFISTTHTDEDLAQTSAAIKASVEAIV